MFCVVFESESLYHISMVRYLSEKYRVVFKKKWFSVLLFVIPCSSVRLQVFVACLANVIFSFCR